MFLSPTFIDIGVILWQGESILLIVTIYNICVTFEWITYSLILEWKKKPIDKSNKGLSFPFVGLARISLNLKPKLNTSG